MPVGVVADARYADEEVDIPHDFREHERPDVFERERLAEGPLRGGGTEKKWRLDETQSQRGDRGERFAPCRRGAYKQGVC